jgi:hypothetical protein
MKAGNEYAPTFIIYTAYKLIPSSAIRFDDHPPEDILAPVPFRRRDTEPFGLVKRIYLDSSTIPPSWYPPRPGVSRQSKLEAINYGYVGFDR